MFCIIKHVELKIKWQMIFTNTNIYILVIVYLTSSRKTSNVTIYLQYVVRLDKEHLPSNDDYLSLIINSDLLISKDNS